MTAHDDLLDADLVQLIADFGEEIQYRQASDPDNPLTFDALVDRDTLKAQREDRRRSVAHPVQITIRKADLDAASTNGDAVLLPREIGDTPAWHPVTARLVNDEIAFVIAVGR